MTIELATTALQPGKPWRNWGRSASARPAFSARPRDEAELVAVMVYARENGIRVKAVGAGHSFTAIAAATGILLDLGLISGLRSADTATGRVTLGAGTHLWQLPAILAPLGLALENMGDIDRQTIAGATSTGTHGTGAAFSGLAAQIVALRLVTADAAVLTISETENPELLPAARLGLGALGIVTEITLQCVPAFLLAAVERPAGFDEVLDDFEAKATAVDHFEFYWWPHTDGVMTKSNLRLPADGQRQPLGRVSGWFEDRVVSNGALSVLCNVGHVLPVLTPPINRLATRVYGNRSYTDHSHEVFASPRTTRFREMEYSIPRAMIPDALRDVRALIDSRGWRIGFPIEVRVAASDSNWLSTASGRESGYIAVHRYFRDDYEQYFRGVEAIMRRYQGRPHWGKIHYQDAESLAGVYPHFADFKAARQRLDPQRVFANEYLERVLG